MYFFLQCSQSKFYSLYINIFKVDYSNSLESQTVGLLVVKIHQGGPLVNDRKVLTINSLLFYSRPVSRTASRFQLPNVDKDNKFLYTICN